MTNKTSNKFSPEVRSRAVRLVFDHERDHPSRVQRPSMRFVPVKSKEQQAGLVLHHASGLLLRSSQSPHTCRLGARSNSSKFSNFEGYGWR